VMDKSKESGGVKKQYFQLPLEIERLSLLPLSWTIVHPINAESPIYGMNQSELEIINPEVIVLVQGFDEVFSQHVNSKRSYVTSEWQWSKKFTKIFSSSPDGNIVLDLSKIDDLENI
jgi:inward rectifier potassium channel